MNGKSTSVFKYTRKLTKQLVLARQKRLTKHPLKKLRIIREYKTASIKATFAITKTRSVGIKLE